MDSDSDYTPPTEIVTWYAVPKEKLYEWEESAPLSQFTVTRRKYGAYVRAQTAFLATMEGSKALRLASEHVTVTIKEVPKAEGDELALIRSMANILVEKLPEEFLSKEVRERAVKHLSKKPIAWPGLTVVDVAEFSEKDIKKIKWFQKNPNSIEKIKTLLALYYLRLKE